jgi:hypothetical protein
MITKVELHPNLVKPNSGLICLKTIQIDSNSNFSFHVILLNYNPDTIGF